jgi:hypothetical protein
MSRRRVLPAVLWLSCAIAAGCALKEVGSFEARGFDPRRYQSYRWAGAEQGGTGDPRLDNNRMFVTRVQRAIDGQLARRGLREAPADAADLVVQFRVRTEQRLEAAETDRSGARQPAAASVYDAGTLVIDLTDARTDALVWRGWAQGSIDGAVDDQPWLDEVVDRAVTRILDRLPRRP